MKLLIQYLFLSLTILAFSGVQASAANSGHMLDNIELIPGEKTSYLTLKGYFEPELFQEISIRPGESAQETLVVIPNAFINNLLMPDREFDQFPVGNMIRQIELEED
ncbi:MAG: LytR family transcriptional regulator, partial [SAR324 cluster bacterium]|nr:LytR family transcriptional regulator [SAR324 cluster bacterium]